jgi:hypothetical protein
VYLMLQRTIRCAAAPRFWESRDYQR